MSKIRDIIFETANQFLEVKEPRLPYQNELNALKNGLRSGKLGLQEWLEAITKLHSQMFDDDMSLEELNAIDNVVKRELIDHLN